MLLKIKNIHLYIFSIFVFLLLTIKGPEFQPDSGSYESYSIVRIGLYPFTISFFKWIFSSYAYRGLAIFQTLLVIITSLKLTNFLKKKFSLNCVIEFAILVAILFPSVSHCKANTIISESLAYPLFLFSVLYFCKMVFSYKNQYISILSIVIFLLCFTRQQFVFLYVVLFIYSFYLFCFEKEYKNIKKICLAAVISLSSFFLAERTYHSVFHGVFAGTPFVGTQLLMRPLFIADNQSLNNFADQKQQIFINTVTEQLKAKEIIDPGGGIKEITAYEYFYNTMYHRTSSPIWGKIWSKDILNKELNVELSDFEVYQIIDKNCLQMSLKLVQENLINFCMHYLKDVIRGMGGYMFIIFLSIIFFYSLFRLLCLREVSNRNIFTLVILATFMHLGNSSLVCLFEPPLTRYTYSTATFLVIMLLILISKKASKDNLCAA